MTSPSGRNNESVSSVPNILRRSGKSPPRSASRGDSRLAGIVQVRVCSRRVRMRIPHASSCSRRVRSSRPMNSPRRGSPARSRSSARTARKQCRWADGRGLCSLIFPPCSLEARTHLPYHEPTSAYCSQRLYKLSSAPLPTHQLPLPLWLRSSVVSVLFSLID